jgi:hypothetical protein
VNKPERPPDFMNTNKLQHEKDYIEFLTRRVNSANFKKKVSPEEFEKTEKKLKKAKLVLRMLET